MSRTSNPSDAANLALAHRVRRAGRDQRLRLARRAALRPRAALADAGRRARRRASTYDGLYYVNSVTHNIKRGEYKQSFNLSRDGLISNTPVVPP